MKVVLDTNVLMSGIFWKGQPGEILELWGCNLFTLVISEEIYSEYKHVSSVLQKKYKVQNIDPILDLIALNAYFVDPQLVDFPRCTDPDDDKFLAAAVFAKAEYIITGDKALLKVSSYKDGRVITPKGFIDSIKSDELFKTSKRK